MTNCRKENPSTFFKTPEPDHLKGNFFFYYESNVLSKEIKIMINNNINSFKYIYNHWKNKLGEAI